MFYSCIAFSNDFPLEFKNAAVSSANKYCNILGNDVLLDGGNAADASITVALCLGVINMFASGIGGGGIMLIHKQGETPFTIDCREMAPMSARPDMFVDDPIKSQLGGLAVAVPGELACMDYVYRKHGSGNVSWKRLFDPVINMTKNGFEVNDLLRDKLVEHSDIIFNDTELTRIFTKNGQLLDIGDTVKMENLAYTLEIIASKGIQEFYNGTLTKIFVDEINDKGGNITLDDFRNYEIKLPGVYKSSYRNYTLFTSKLPFSGGLMLIQSLNILENFQLHKKSYNAETIHLIIETMKFAFSNRLVLGDPDYTNLTYVEPAMLSKQHALTLAKRIKTNTTFPPPYYLDLAKKESDILAPKGHGTEHISIVDSNRMAVSFTTSVNLGWGAGFIGPKSGILWNNHMDDFNSPPQDDNGGLPSYSVNYPGPRKRPLSSMTPTLVYDNNGKLILVTGGSGGPKIFTGTLLNTLLVLDFNQNLKQASRFSRYHHQLKPDHVTIEPSMDEEIIRVLDRKGHTVSFKFILNFKMKLILTVYYCSSNMETDLML